MAGLNYAYYPGCASREITSEANKATQLVASHIGITLHNMPRANCCGAGLMTDYDYDLSIALNARIFAEAESMGMDILTICSTCYMVMNTAMRDLNADAALFERTNAILAKAGLKYGGGVKIKHLLNVITHDYGIDALKDNVVRPLDRLKVAPFYGCHTLRPGSAFKYDDASRPSSLESVIRALGATPVDNRGKTRCCGFQVDLVNEDVAVKMTAARLLEAKAKGADCIVTPCPFCHINLDNYQGLAEKKVSRKISVPVFHLAQLIGLAIGLSENDMGLSRHIVSPQNILRNL